MRSRRRFDPRRFSRKALSARFTQEGKRVRVVVGRKGLALADDNPVEPAGGLSADASLPHKREGDLRAPAGIFPLRSLFGSGRRRAAWRLPYERMTRSHRCVDDARSRYYGSIVDRRTAPRAVRHRL